MATGAGPRQARRGPGVLTTVVLALVIAACSSSPGSVVSSQPSSAPSSAPSDDSGGNPAPVSTSGIAPGKWQGTIRFHAVLNTVKDDTSTSGQGVFQETTTTHDTTQADATDEFTVTGSDPADISYGISEVQLTGPVANHGTTLERHVGDSDKSNALGCHWTDEVGTEVSGSWTGNGYGSGSIRFQDDGSYTIQMGAGGDPVTGAEPPTPALPKRLWETNTIIAGAAADCPGPGTVQMTTDGPIVQWASSITGAYDQIQGKLGVASPGAVVDGSASFKETLPDATLTVTWHLVHDSPITLPHN